MCVCVTNRIGNIGTAANAIYIYIPDSCGVGWRGVPFMLCLSLGQDEFQFQFRRHSAYNNFVARDNDSHSLKEHLYYITHILLLSYLLT